jgi:hypothetical protein
MNKIKCQYFMGTQSLDLGKAQYVPSPCSTKIFSHSETGVVNVTAARSFMYPDTGRSSWPLMDATSTSVMDTTPSKMPPLSSASLPSLPPGCFC